MRRVVFAVIFSGLASFAFGQIQGSALRAKYGPPLPGQVFIVRPGVEMTVTFGPNDIACKLEIPAGAATKEQLDSIAQEVVPTATRGKELRNLVMINGLVSWALTDYEIATVTQGSGWLTITSKDKSCAAVTGKP